MVEKKITKIQWTRKAQKRLKDIKTYYKEHPRNHDVIAHSLPSLGKQSPAKPPTQRAFSSYYPKLLKC